MENLIEGRQFFDSLGLKYLAHPEVKVETVILAGVTCYRFVPPQVVSPETVVYLHGGAFKLGSIRSHRGMVSHIAAATGRVVLFVEYSLAPEHPFPQALNETMAIVRELSQTASDKSFSLMGDSAGGNLAMATALNLKRHRLPSALYHVLISPWVNMGADAASYAENEKNDPILNKPLLQQAAEQYMASEPATNPLVSPVLGSFEGFSPTLMLVGALEILRDDALDLNKALKKAGSASRLEVFDKVTHVWPLADIESPDSREALRIMREFMDEVAVGTSAILSK
jgi:monoterpene epsilon-lactone hydrolase